MEFCVLNFLSTMERIFYGVSRVKLSFYNGKQWKQSSMEFCVLNFLSTMETIFYGNNGKNLLWSFNVKRVKLSFYNGNNLLWLSREAVLFAISFLLNLSTMERIFYGVSNVLNFLSTMETIFYGVSRVKLSFYNGKNLLCFSEVNYLNFTKNTQFCM